MNTIQNLFEQAQLAESAYANFIDPLTGAVFANPNKIEGALTTEKFSPTQAAAFAEQWSVVDQFDTSGLFGVLGTGFSATVFQNRLRANTVWQSGVRRG